MCKRIFSLILAFIVSLSIFSFSAFAEEHIHSFGSNKRGLDMSAIPADYNCPVTFYETPCESLCGYSKYEWTFAGSSDSFVDKSGLSAIQVYLHWRKWLEKAYGASANLEKITSDNAGANIPAAGGRNPKGYGSEGKANVTSSGVEVLWVEPLGISSSDVSGFKSYAPSSLIAGASGSGDKYFSSYYLTAVYYFTAPVSGLYYIGSSGSPYDCGTFNSFWNNSWVRKDLVFTYDEPYQKSMSLAEGKSIYLYFYTSSTYVPGLPYKYYLNNVPIFVEPLADSSITTTNNLTINNNTWTGNIYTDSSTNLTYIYPQYTTINESGDTVTNISENPIIYNSETKQYYTYDSTTNNYYYITYEQPATPTPSPSPDPGTNPTPTPGDSGDISTPESGKPGSSSGSGQSWWDKLLSKIGDAIIDGLLGAVSTVLKLIFKLFSTILGWIIWAVSRVFDLLPFLPPGLGALLIGGVVVCFIIGLIKFIRG